MAGDTDVVDRLKKGATVNGKKFKNHIDGYDLLPHLTGEQKESPRQGFFYFSDDGDVLGLRFDNWKIVFMEQRCQGTLQVWAEPFTRLRLPKLFNLRLDPYERADTTSNTYNDWLLHNGYLMLARRRSWPSSWRRSRSSSRAKARLVHHRRRAREDQRGRRVELIGTSRRRDAHRKEGTCHRGVRRLDRAALRDCAVGCRRECRQQPLDPEHRLQPARQLRRQPLRSRRQRQQRGVVARHLAAQAVRPVADPARDAADRDDAEHRARWATDRPGRHQPVRLVLVQGRAHRARVRSATDPPHREQGRDGHGQVAGGFAAVVVAPHKWGLLGGLVTWQQSFAGDGDRPNVSTLQVQPVLIYNLPDAWYLRSSATSSFDLRHGNYYIPIGFGAGKVWKAGTTTCNVFAEPQWTVAHDGSGAPKFQVFFGLNLQFPL
jgi:hypothetical protein